jgi:hypothetical protein
MARLVYDVDLTDESVRGSRELAKLAEIKVSVG